MQIVSNQTLVRNRVRLGTGLHLAALAVFGIGLLFSMRFDLESEYWWASWAAITIGMGFYVLGQTQLRRWGAHGRQTEEIGKAIRGLDDRYKLYAYLASNLPNYVLVSPAGVHVLVTRSEGGEVSCERGRWKKSGRNILTALFDRPFGNPSYEAQVDLRRIEEVLEREGLKDVPTAALVVFTNPDVRLRLSGCNVTVTRVKELKDVMRRAAGKGASVALPAARVREVQTVFDRRMQTARSWR